MMHVLLLILLLLPWPPALSLSTSETTPGATLTAVATAPAGAEVALRLPTGVTAELLERQGQTVRWRLTVADDAPLERVPHQVVLLVDGRAVASAPLRVWTEAVRQFRVWLPAVMKSPEREARGGAARDGAG